MNNILKENIDFEFIEKENNYRFKHKYPKLKDGSILNRKPEPYRNSVVYCYDNKNNILKLVLIKDGDYLSNGRVSNWWVWYELNESLEIEKEVSGYGCFYETKEKFNIEISYKVIKGSD